MNESLKKAQKAYQSKCRIVNIRFNTETETDLIEWLNNQESVGSKIKELIRENIKKEGE